MRRVWPCGAVQWPNGHCAAGERKAVGRDLRPRHLRRRWRLPFERRDYMVKKPLSLLAGSGLQHAATTYLAESVVQDYLFTSRVDVYVRQEDAAEWHELIVEDGLVGGGNFRLLFGDDHVFYKSLVVEGVAVVSLPQIAADLYDVGGACAEAADMLVERVKDGAV